VDKRYSTSGDGEALELPAVERLRWNRGDGLDSRKLEEEADEEPALSPASKEPDLHAKSHQLMMESNQQGSR
jgi:hypothetical protein